MKKYLLLLACFLLLLSCKKEQEATTQIRIFNNTGVGIDKITINTGSDERTYTEIRNGQYSGYQPVVKAYRYASGEALMHGKTYRCQIIDYVGEKELGPGKFTYEVSLYDVNNTSALYILLKQ